MKTIISLILCIAAMQYAGAQNAFVLQIHTVGGGYQESLPNAFCKITQGDSTWYGKSNRSGLIYQRIYGLEDVRLEVSHGIFDSDELTIKLPRKMEDGDTVRRTVPLNFRKVTDLQQVNVLVPGVAKVVYQSEKLSVSDFELLSNGEILLLAYPKRLEKGSELLVFSNGTVLEDFKLQENPIELVRDYRGIPHVVCEHGVYGIHRSEGHVGISNIDKAYYMSYISPIIDTIGTKMYFSNFNPKYPAVDYLHYDQQDSTYKKILKVQDDLMMELYRAEYKWADIRTKLWAKKMEMETGIDKEIWVGAKDFTSSIYYKEVYAPMFERNDTLFVFDYYKDQLFSFDPNGDVIDSVAIYHHYQPKQTGWKRKLIQDQATGQIYAFFEKGGTCFVRCIDVKTGLLGEKVVFEHKYIDKLTISGNLAYYIYRPYESAQKKFLYLSKLPFSFPESNVHQGSLISTETGK